MVTEKKLESFCVLPWTHLFASERGWIHACCISLDSGEPVRDSEGKAFEIGRAGDWAKARNSEQMRSLRKEMLAGLRPRACSRCFKLEDAGISSHRRTSNNAYEGSINALLERLDIDGSTREPIQSIDLRLGNQCNLRCRMCSPVSSRLLLKEWQQIQPAFSASQRDGLQEIRWPDEPIIWDLVKEHLSAIRELHFAGGEPLINQNLEKFLAEVVAAGHAKKISLSFNTNLTFLSESFLEVSRKFRSVNFMVSVDGLAELNDFIRFPSRWAELEKNLARLDPVNISFNITVQAYNYLGLADLLRHLVDRWSFPNIYLSPLMHPVALAAKVLPLELQEIAEMRLREFCKSLPDSLAGQKLERSVLGLLDFIGQEQRKDCLPEFKRITHIFDLRRGQNLVQLVPEFQAVFGNDYRESIIR